MSTPTSKSHESLRRLCLAAVFAALVFVATAYLPRIPTVNGYVHLGDTLVFLCASLLPMPYAVAASAIGGGLADLLTGYAIWAPASFIIKGATAFFFTSRGKKILCAKNFIAIAIAAVICVGGYYVWAAIFISGSWAAPVSELFPNLMQTVVSGVLYVVIALVFDRVPALRRYF
ncbi:MAG: TIGR04002 family protein [Clostridia bacterium]|nr:TIGR04002 family protein [Clostridia bacterium]